MSANEATSIDAALDREWYHTIELAPGRTTRGAIDLRKVAPRVLPDDLSGKRVLDVGTYDGFWAFELERRNPAEAIAVDLDEHDESDWPPVNRERLAREVRESTVKPGERFWLAHEAIGSNVRRVPSSIYDIDEAKLGGKVDYVVIGDLLLHLRDPVKGLERVHDVLAPGGKLLSVEPISMMLTLLWRHKAAARLRAAHTTYDWWVPNTACLAAWLYLAGFAVPKRKAFFQVEAVKTMRQWHVAFETAPA